MNAVLAITIASPGMVALRSVALAARQDSYQRRHRAAKRSYYIILREMLPNILAPIIVEATIRVAFAIMLFATLSFSARRAAARAGVG